MNLPRGYVGYTVPYTLAFNTNAVGLVKPFYTPAMRNWVTSTGTSPVYGFDYMLLFHNESNGGPQLFPNGTTVHQNVVLEGLAEFNDGEQVPFREDFYEEFALVGELAEDVHWFGATPETDGVARYQLNLAYASSVMPRIASWENGNAAIFLSETEQAEHWDSLTLVIGLFYGLDIGLGAPVRHMMDWNAQTIDPARAREITWDSGNLHYEGNSPVRRVLRSSRPPIRRRSVCHQALDWHVGGASCRVTLESHSLGPGQNTKLVRILGPHTRAQLVINGPAEVFKIESEKLFLGGIELVLTDEERYQFDNRSISVPRRGGVLGVAYTQPSSQGTITLRVGSGRQFRYAHKLLADFVPWLDAAIRKRMVTHVLKDADGDIYALANPKESWSPRSSLNVIDDINRGLFEYEVERTGTRSTKIHVVSSDSGSYLRTVGDDVKGNNLDELPTLMSPRMNFPE